MKVLLQNAFVCHPHSPFHSKICDISISEKGIIETIELASKRGKTAPKGYTLIDCKKAVLAPAFMDMRCHLADPGYEHKETLETAARAGIAGGYSALACLPDTLPVTDAKTQVRYIRSKSKSLPLNIYPYGSISSEMKGIELSELFDMHQSGAIGFTDADRGISNAGLMSRALLYAKIFGGLILSHAEDKSLSNGSSIHEGTVSTYLGLKGAPAMAEEVMLQRDLELARYTESHIHFSHISSKKSVDIIRKAKKQGLPVTCDVAVANLCFTDEALISYDSNYKVNPPLRSKEHQKALWEGLTDGTIDAIVSDHKPQNDELKTVEFEYAADGMIMLQTSLSLLLLHKPESLSLSTLIEKLSITPRHICNLPIPGFEKGAEAEWVLFDPLQKWSYTEENNRSLSGNSPVMGLTLTGKVLAVYAKNRLHTF